MGWWGRRLAAIALVSASFCAATASAEPAATFFGMGDWGELSGAELRTLDRAGVGSARIGIDLAVVRAEGVQAYDEAVGDAARAGVELLVVLTDAPLIRGRYRSRPPLTRRALRSWGRFAEDVAGRYGPGGTYWLDHWWVPYVPVRAWQVWNEPNLRVHWYGQRPNPRSYVSLLRATRRALRAVDPDAQIVLAGIPDTRRGRRVAPYLGGLYRQRGFKGLFDVAALHPYGHDAAEVEQRVDDFRAILRRHGDRKRAIWITEIGWATEGRHHGFRTTIAGQADRVAETFQLFLEERRRWRLGRVFWFALQDRDLGDTEQNWWGPHTGLFYRSGFAKPAWRELVYLTGGLPDDWLGLDPSRRFEPQPVLGPEPCPLLPLC